MTANTNLTHAECQERARLIATDRYRVELDLSQAADPASTTFRSQTTITFAATGPGTWVDLIADRVTAATLNGEQVDVSAYDGARLPIDGLAAHNTLVIDADCYYSRTGEGLHRFTDPADGLTYLFTHFEPTDARRLYANFEQPDLKGRFTFVVTAPEGWRILSGQPEVSRSTNQGLATVTFDETPPLSTYVTAVAAGPYHRIGDTWSTTRADGAVQEVELGVLCRSSMAPYLDAAEILTITKQGLDFYHREFEFPYPWGKYDQIHVPEYNLGAMENPGLVTVTEAYIHRGRATRAQRQRRANTVLHELAHMWFGDLVTMRWWDGVWLKESFADLMGYHVSATTTEFTTAWASFASGRKAWAYQADQQPTTHPVVATVDDLEAARQNFDGITYAKGAAALKQLMAYVGQDAFFAGTRAYFATHAFGNTELDDLLSPLERASGRDLKAWSQVWLETAGISELIPVVDEQDGVLQRLTIVQRSANPEAGEAISRPHRLVVGLYEVTGGELRRTTTLELDVDGTETVVEQAAGQRADLVLINDDDLTYAKVRLDKRSLATARAHLSSIASPLSRSLIWSAWWNATRDAVLPAQSLLDTVAAQAISEPDPVLLQIVLNHAESAVTRYLPRADRGAAGQVLHQVLRDGLRDAEPGSDAQRTWAVHLAQTAGLTGAGLDAVRAVLDGRATPDGLGLDADLRWTCWQALAAQDAATLAELDAALAADDTMTGRTAYLLARASRPSAQAKAEAWDRATGDSSVTNDQLRSLVQGFSHPGSALAAAYADRYFDSLVGWWQTRTMVMATIMAEGLYPGGSLEPGQTPESHPVVQAAQSWLSSHADAPTALRRIVIEQLDDHLRSLRAQASSAG